MGARKSDAGPSVASRGKTGLSAIARRPVRAWWLFGLVLISLLATVVFFGVSLLAHYPRINDISTDVEQPPAFEAILPLRMGLSNGPGYPGEAVARKQRQAYPDIGPAWFDDPPAHVFDTVLATARAMGWLIVAADAERGRVEAVDTTRILRFKDDIVLRVRGEERGTRVDMRSKSRLGRGDLGANAARIRAFMTRLRGAGLTPRE